MMSCLRGMQSLSQPTRSLILKTIAKRQRAPPKTSKSTCSINESFFDPFTPSSAYWLGFIYGKGSFSYQKTGNKYLSLKFGFQCTDADHLKNFALATGSTYKISFSTRRQTKTFLPGSNKTCQVMTRIFNPVFCKRALDLRSTRTPPPPSNEEHSQSPSTSKSILRWPLELPDNLSNHFIRVFFDAHG